MSTRRDKPAIGSIQDYKSRLDDPASRRFETFSYLPKMDPAAIRRQVEYILQRGWIPAIEHVEPGRVGDTYWYLWKLPMFSEQRAEVVLAEAEACRQAYPEHHVRLIGYDNKRQTQGASMVIHRAKGI